MINKNLEEYLLTEILPRYDSYDKGHNRDHILEVVGGAMELAANYEVDLDMVYTSAMYHDLGLVEGRDIHHLASAKMLRADEFLTGFFTDEEIEIIAEAIEDHRASAKSAPRSIYGEILSSADRIIEVDKIITRTYYHGLKHYEGITFDEQIERIFSHISEKYGDGGYLKVPILTEKNRTNLERLREMVRDEKAFKNYCTQLINNI